MILSVNEQNFRQEVLASSTPVIVHFSAPWCGLCRLIEPLLMRFQAEWTGEIKLVVINADENFKLANTYRLTTLPTLILFDRGRPIHRLEGFQGRDDLLRALENAITSFGLASVSTARK